MQPPHGKTVIVANGAFPQHALPLAALRLAQRVVCCDGAAAKLLAAGTTPDWIVGDLDSLPPALRERHSKKLIYVREQSTNDLSKAFHFCLANGWHDIVILGATGLREDHAVANLSLLVEFAAALAAAAQRQRAALPRLPRGPVRPTQPPTGRVVLLSDSGIFTPALSSMLFRAYPGQAVSIFSPTGAAEVYAEGLKYPLDGIRFERWWQGTLNEASGDSFKLLFADTPLLVFQAY